VAKLVDTVIVSYEKWEDYKKDDIYKVYVGPAEIEIDWASRILRLDIFGSTTDHQLDSAENWVLAAMWGHLQITDIDHLGHTEFKLTWDEVYEGQGRMEFRTQQYAMPMGCLPPGTVAWSEVMDPEKWEVSSHCRTLEEQREIYGTDAKVEAWKFAGVTERNKKLLLLAA